MSRWGLALLVLAWSAAGCTTIRDFLIPPPSVESRDRSLPGERALVLQASSVAGHAGADAVLVRGHRIAAVGSVTQLPDAATVTNRSRDSGTLERGPVDERASLPLIALAQDGADLRELQHLERLGPALGPALAVRAEGQLVLAWGLAPTLFGGLTAAALDAVVDDVPLAVADRTGRVRVNRAFAAQQTKDLRRALETRGGLLEGGLDPALLRRFDLPLAARLRATLASGLDALHRAGLTGVAVAGLDTNALRAVRDLEQGGRLALRVRVWLDADDPGARGVLADSQRQRRLDMGAAKRRARGTPGARTRQRAAPTRGDRVLVSGLHVAVEGPFGATRIDADTLRRIAAEVAERSASLSVGVTTPAGVATLVDALTPLRAAGRAPAVRLLPARRFAGAELAGAMGAVGRLLPGRCTLVLTKPKGAAPAQTGLGGGCEVVWGAGGPGTDWPAWVRGWRAQPDHVRPRRGEYADLVVWPADGARASAVYVGGDRQLPLD